MIATELARGFAEEGHSVHFVSTSRPFRFPEEHPKLTFHSINIPSYDVFPDASYGMSAASTVSRLIRNHDFDCIHVHYAFPHALSGDLARTMAEGSAPPLVTTLHGTDVFLAEDHPDHYEIVRSALERSDAITSVSQFLKKRTQNIFGNEFNDIQVIPNFVDPARFHPDAGNETRQKFSDAYDGILFHVSNFRRIKRSGNAIRLLRLIRQNGASAHLMMVGEGPERKNAQRLAHEFHLREHVSWIESTSTIESYLAAADVLLVTSELESFSMAALEAMSCEVPVLNLARGGIREVVRDEKDGYHFEPGALDELADRGAKLLKAPSLRTRIGRQGRNRVKETFSTRVVLEQYLNLYERLSDDGAHPETTH